MARVGGCMGYASHPHAVAGPDIFLYYNYFIVILAVLAYQHYIGTIIARPI